MYCSELRAGLIDGSATPIVASETASVASVDGRNALGAVVSKFALELCVKKAKATGIGLVVCRRSNHFGIAGYWSELALREGLIAFSFTNTSPFMVPTRAISRAGGTNPIACFCAATAGDSFQLDMATTTVPVGKVEVCHRQGQRIPVGWAVDAAGQSCTDPASVMTGGGLTPLGGLEETAGYKGYGLNMMVEILCSVLSGCETFGPDVLPWRADRGRAIDYGHCFLCIDPEQVLPGGQFSERLSRYLARMRGLEAADPLRSVLVPGDPERAETARAASEGVRLSQSVALGFRRFVRELGCGDSLPQQLHCLPEDVTVPVHPATAGMPTR
mmetsp:Transcript_28735/g.66947  ORF Transcript_28735/g.66947 Transcript_28735/m.66947 type:complete len:330 (-) Transcript_28735:115-1104(-)